MIHIKSNKQQELFDPWRYLSPKRRQMLENDWPGLFREHLLDELPVNKLANCFAEGMGRPTKELHTVLGALLLQQTMDLTDPATIEQLCFNIQWHYALNIPEESDDAKYISEKTLYTMRQLMIEEHLDDVMFDAIGQKLATVFNVETKKQRIDSVHIRSNMRRLGRIRIFAETISKLLVNLKRHHQDLFDTVDQKILDRYWSKKAMASFSLVKPSESAKTLHQVSGDLFDLIEQFKDHQKVCAMHSYKLMQRVLAEQCHMDPDGDGSKVAVKNPREISSDSLQNPSDPDATYDSHKGQGYQMQIMETFSQNEDPEKKQQTLNLITHVSVQTACEHDANALMPAITDVQDRQLSPEQVLADTLYGGDNNHQSAEVKNIELVSPVKKANTSDTILLTGFTFNEKGYVTTCPAGNAPMQVKYKGKTDRFSAAFNQEACDACPLFDQCKLVSGKNKYFLRYNSKQYRIAVRRAIQQQESFVETYRWRAGIEATMSELDRRTGIKQLRVRGMPAVRFAATLKATGLNMLRASAVRKARSKAARADSSIINLIDWTFTVVKEQIFQLLSSWGRFCLKYSQLSERELYMAA
jgi:hypothetical protein